MEITECICKLLDICPQIRPTTEFLIHKRNGGEKQEFSQILDYRDIIHPKHPLPDPDFVPRRYYQVYERKYGFQPNLSIVDLLFNMGNESILYL